VRQPIALILLAALAACTSPAPTNESSAAPAVNSAAEAPKPDTDGTLSAAEEAAGIARLRAEWLPACIGGGRDAAPPGTPVERHCACALDRTLAGRTVAELEEERRSGDYGPRFQGHMRACIREIRR